MTEKELNQYYTAEELSELLRIKRKTIYTQISKGSFPIPYLKMGKNLLFPISDVVKFINSCRQEANTLPIKNMELIKPKIINQRIRVR